MRQRGDSAQGCDLAAEGLVEMIRFRAAEILSEFAAGMDRSRDGGGAIAITGAGAGDALIGEPMEQCVIWLAGGDKHD